MNRNQKIALGCGGAGCLGLIVLIGAGTIFWFSYQRQPRAVSNSNISRNRNSNLNSNLNRNSDSSTSSSISEDDKHRLFQAASMTQDAALLQKVMTKLNLRTGATAEYQEFARNHIGWAIKNLDFIQSLDTPQKARDYVNEHLDD
ncbi:MAG TPA: hypothetical protein VJ124_26940 [Pyrinomonadaceae bacterium]|nr:hypothetical protein [Pyrinomonadaceae bacterium]